MNYSRVFRLIFQVFYRRWPNDIPHWNTAIILSLIVLLNAGWIIFIVISLFNLELPANSPTLGLVVYATLVFANYLIFIQPKLYEEFKSNFNNLELTAKKQQLRNGSILLISGYLLPILMIIILLKV